MQEVKKKKFRKIIFAQLQKARQDYEKKIRSLKEEVDQKNDYIEVIKKGHMQAQEKVFQKQYLKSLKNDELE